MKSANITSATARQPLAAAPAAAPVKPSSQIGVSIIRSGPNSCHSPLVCAKLPPRSPVPSPR